MQLLRYIFLVLVLSTISTIHGAVSEPERKVLCDDKEEKDNKASNAQWIELNLSDRVIIDDVNKTDAYDYNWLRSHHIRLSAILNDYQCIQKLTLNQWSIDDQVVTDIVKKHQNIQVLILPHSRELSDKGVIEIANHCKDLKELDLSGCQNITDEAIDHLLNKCKKLENINLSDCSKITPSMENTITFHMRLQHHRTKKRPFYNMLSSFDLKTLAKHASNTITSLQEFKLLNDKTSEEKEANSLDDETNSLEATLDSIHKNIDNEDPCQIECITTIKKQSNEIRNLHSVFTRTHIQEDELLGFFNECYHDQLNNNPRLSLLVEFAIVSKFFKKDSHPLSQLIHNILTEHFLMLKVIHKNEFEKIVLPNIEAVEENLKETSEYINDMKEILAQTEKALHEEKKPWMQAKTNNILKKYHPDFFKELDREYLMQLRVLMTPTNKQNNSSIYEDEYMPLSHQFKHHFITKEEFENILTGIDKDSALRINRVHMLIDKLKGLIATAQKKAQALEQKLEQLKKDEEILKNRKNFYEKIWDLLIYTLFLCSKNPKEASAIVEKIEKALLESASPETAKKMPLLIKKVLVRFQDEVKFTLQTALIFNKARLDALTMQALALCSDEKDVVDRVAAQASFDDQDSFYYCDDIVDVSAFDQARAQAKLTLEKLSHDKHASLLEMLKQAQKLVKDSEVIIQQTTIFPIDFNAKNIMAYMKKCLLILKKLEHKMQPPCLALVPVTPAIAQLHSMLAVITAQPPHVSAVCAQPSGMTRKREEKEEISDGDDDKNEYQYKRRKTQKPTVAQRAKQSKRKREE